MGLLAFFAVAQSVQMISLGYCGVTEFESGIMYMYYLLLKNCLKAWGSLRPHERHHYSIKSLTQYIRYIYNI